LFHVEQFGGLLINTALFTVGGTVPEEIFTVGSVEFTVGFYRMARDDESWGERAKNGRKQVLRSAQDDNS